MSDPKPQAAEAKPPETFKIKGEIAIPQRDGTNVVLPEGHEMPMADAKRLEKAGVLNLNTGKQAKAKE